MGTLDHIRRDIEALTGRKLKGPENCAAAGCEGRPKYVYRRPDEMGYTALRLCEMHAEAARRIDRGLGTVTLAARKGRR